MSALSTFLPLVGSYPAERRPLLSTVRITSPILFKNVARIAADWSQIAVQRIAETGFSLIDQRLKALQAISVDLVTHIAEASSTLFAAIDSAKKIQGLALATFCPEETRIKYLETHPDNIPIPGHEMVAVRGAGTALVRHIAHSVLATETLPRVINLLSAESSQAFYEKIGFEPSTLLTWSMQLQEAGLRRLVQRGNSGYHRMLVDDRELVPYASELH